MNFRMWLETQDPQSDEFKQWFGQSKVVDSQGRPQVVYHRTKGQFSFPSLDINRGEMGIHFGTRKQTKSITGGETGSFYLNIKNPIRLRDMGDFRSDIVASQLSDMGLMSSEGWWQFPLNL